MEATNDYSIGLKFFEKSDAEKLKEITKFMNPKCAMNSEIKANDELKNKRKNIISKYIQKSLWFFLTGKELNKDINAKQDKDERRDDSKLLVFKNSANLSLKIEENESPFFMDKIFGRFDENIDEATEFSEFIGIGSQLMGYWYMIEIKLTSKTISDVYLTFTAWQITAIVFSFITTVAIDFDLVLNIMSQQLDAKVLCKFCENSIKYSNLQSGMVLYCPKHKFMKDKSNVIYKFISDKNEIFISRSLNDLDNDYMTICTLRICKFDNKCRYPHSEFELFCLKILKYLEENNKTIEVLATKSELQNDSLKEIKYFDKVNELYDVVRRDDVEELKLFLKHSEDDLLYSCIDSGESILFIALKYKSVEMLRFILADREKLDEIFESKTLNTIHYEDFINKKNKNNHTAFSDFFESIQVNQALDEVTSEICSLFLKCDYYDINEEIGEGTTIVHEIVRKSQANLLDIAMKHYDFDVRMVDKNGKSLVDVVDPNEPITINKILSHLLSFI